MGQNNQSNGAKMLKSQDVVLLLKLLSKPENLELSQNQLAVQLCMSVSEIHAAFKRLREAGLIQFSDKSSKAKLSLQLVYSAIEEFLLSGLKYVFPAKTGEFIRGIPTSYAAPVLEKFFTQSQDPIPVWPYAEGSIKGLAVEPLYRSVPESLTQYPDEDFYDLLALIDAIRIGRARERQMAAQLLQEKLKNVRT